MSENKELDEWYEKNLPERSMFMRIPITYPKDATTAVQQGEHVVLALDNFIEANKEYYIERNGYKIILVPSDKLEEYIRNEKWPQIEEMLGNPQKFFQPPSTDNKTTT